MERSESFAYGWPTVYVVEKRGGCKLKVLARDLRAKLLSRLLLEIH
jgi:hypothetical protein